MKPHVIVDERGMGCYRYSALIFMPDETKSMYHRSGRYMRWYHTVRATSLDALCRGVNEALLFFPIT